MCYQVFLSIVMYLIFACGQIILNVALQRQLGMLHNLYQAGLLHVLWVTHDVT
jgi:hypothetical protein